MILKLDFISATLLLLTSVTIVSGQTIWGSQNANRTGIFNHTYSEQVSSSSPISFHFSKRPNYGGAIRVHVSSPYASVASPILVVIKRQRGVQSWQIPVVLEKKFSYKFVNRTLCPIENHAYTPYLSESVNQYPKGEEFFIEILSLSETLVRFVLRVDTFPRFQVQAIDSFTLEVTPSAPQYVQYTMHTDASRVLVKLNATEGASYCSFLSIQSVRCPVGDIDSDLRVDGRYQTVTAKGAIEVSKDQFPDGQFYIVVLVKPHDEHCSAQQNMLSVLRPRSSNSNSTDVDSMVRMKVVNITVVDSLAENRYVLATVLPISIFLGFFILTVVLQQTGFRNWNAILRGKVDDIVLPTTDAKWGLATLFEKSATGKSIPLIWEWGQYQKSHLTAMLREQRLAPNAKSNNGEVDLIITLPMPVHTDTPVLTRVTDFDLIDGVYQVPAPGEGTLLRMSDINKRSSRSLTQTAREYGCSLMTVFIFYSLPVLQLVMTHQGLLIVTGNEDLCYYNFSCANRVGVLSDFNHIISNIGYAILGLLFLIIVRRRSMFTEKLRLSVQNLDDYGIPSQLGLFYGMGLALTMEGVMSACYHVCPSYNNFQFDTSFMYLMSGLLILKLYHSRHPDVLPKSYAAYAAFAAVILIAVVGVISRNIVYWIVFSVIHGICTIVIGLQLMAVGYLELLSVKSVGHLYTACRECAQKCRKWREAIIPWSRIILAILITFVNVLFAVTGPLWRMYDFASHLLFILQANLMIYATFYVWMKIITKEERISRATCLYFLLAAPAWGVGMYYFTQGLTNWEFSAATSREGNRDCFFLGFYDEHDVWHMCSAVGLFFTFMMLLTLDDDLATVTRDKIAVF